MKDYIKEGKTQIIDWTNKSMVMPGATVGHCHYFGVYGARLQPSVCGFTYQEILEELKTQVKTLDLKQFMTYGLKWIELLPNAESGKNFADELKSIAPVLPIFVYAC